MGIFAVFGRKWEFKVDTTIWRDVPGTEYRQLAHLLQTNTIRAMRRFKSCHVYGVRDEEEQPKETRAVPPFLLFVNKCELCCFWTWFSRVWFVCWRGLEAYPELGRNWGDCHQVLLCNSCEMSPFHSASPLLLSPSRFLVEMVSQGSNLGFC